MKTQEILSLLALGLLSACMNETSSPQATVTISDNSIVSPFEQSKVQVNDALFAASVSEQTARPLALLIDNPCMDRLSADDSARLKKLFVFRRAPSPALTVQAYPVNLRRGTDEKDLAEAIEQNRCVIGLAENPLVSLDEIRAPLVPSVQQKFHQRIGTESAYGSYFFEVAEDPTPVVVAVVDSGVDTQHPDLSGNIWTHPINGTRIVNFSADANSLDENGHGTHVAGLIAGTGRVTGTAQGVKLMAIKAMTKKGSGLTSDIVNGILYALENGADVINLSVGGSNLYENNPGPFWDKINLNKLYIEAFRRAVTRNATLVVAAGNDSYQIDPVNFSPSGLGDLYGTVVVGSADSSEVRLSDFSNYGSLVSLFAPGAEVAIANQPRSCIYSTLPMNYTSHGSNYGSLCGTSMATPIAAGAAAMVVKDLKRKRLPYNSNHVKRILMEETTAYASIAGKGKTGYLDLSRLAERLKVLRDLTGDSGGANLNSPVGRLISAQYAALFMRSPSEEIVSLAIEYLGGRKISQYGALSYLISQPEFQDVGQPVRNDTKLDRIELALLGSSLGSERSEFLRFLSLPSQQGFDVPIPDLIAAYYSSEEFLRQQKLFGAQGLPLLDGDLAESPEYLAARAELIPLASGRFRSLTRHALDFSQFERLLVLLKTQSPEKAASILAAEDLVTKILTEVRTAYGRTWVEMKNSSDMSGLVARAKAHLLSGGTIQDIRTYLNESNEKKLRDIYYRNIPIRVPPSSLQVSVWQTKLGLLLNSGKSLEAALVEMESDIRLKIESMKETYADGYIGALMREYLLREEGMYDQATGLAFWRGRLQATGSIERVAAEMRKSEEALVRRLYDGIVGRSSEEMKAGFEALRGDVERLQNGQTTPEALTRDLGNKAETFVRDLYRKYLGLRATAKHVQIYVERLESNQISRSQLETYLRGQAYGAPSRFGTCKASLGGDLFYVDEPISLVVISPRAGTAEANCGDGWVPLRLSADGVMKFSMPAAGEFSCQVRVRMSEGVEHCNLAPVRMEVIPASARTRTYF